MKNYIKMLALVVAFLNINQVSAQTKNHHSNTVNAIIQIDEDENQSLIWTAGREVNTSYFIIEKSIDTVNFNSILIKNASSSTILPKSYCLEDLANEDSISYYRIILVLMDGHRIYSNIVKQYNPDKISTIGVIAKE